MSATKETLCTSCGHRQVCSKVNEFIAVQKAVDNLTIGTDEDGGVMFVRDAQWLHVSIQCSHRISNVSVKGEVDYGTRQGAF